MVKPAAKQIICITPLMERLWMSMENKDYISGIYNYCDRWCEKCSFTSSCLLFTNESKIITYEILNNGDLTGVEKVFLEDDGDEPDSDDVYESDFIFEEEEIPDNEEDPLDEIDDDLPPHSLELLADEYFKKAHPFLNELNDKFKLYPADKEKLESPLYRKLFEHFEIISWYQAFIGAKVNRALMGKADLLKEDDEEVREFTMQDVNGSAKIAAIGISRSIDSLNQLYNLLEEHHTQISDLLVLAGKILNEVAIEFPGYKDFLRPGLDT